MKSDWGGGGWGTWHTGPDSVGPCPQGDGFHSTLEALDLNEAASVERRASLRAAHDRWLGKTPDMQKRPPESL